MRWRWWWLVKVRLWCDSVKNVGCRRVYEEELSVGVGVYNMRFRRVFEELLFVGVGVSTAHVHW